MHIEVASQVSLPLSALMQMPPGVEP